MLVPETEPEYVTPPTAPKRIALPLTVPVMGRVAAGVESFMVPVSFDPDCCQVSVNVPAKAPL
jgi:hypothetical protein